MASLKPRLVALSLAALLSGVVSAQIMKWVDENGRVQYGDKIPHESKDKASVELDQRGLLRKQTPPAPTAEQIREMEAKKAIAADEVKRKAEQARKDAALNAKYVTVADIDRARDRQLFALDTNLRIAEQRQKSLLEKKQAAEATLAKHPQAAAAKIEVAAATEELPQLAARIERWNGEKEAIRTRFAEERARFEEMQASGRNASVAPMVVPKAN